MLKNISNQEIIISVVKAGESRLLLMVAIQSILVMSLALSVSIALRMYLCTEIDIDSPYRSSRPLKWDSLSSILQYK